jgi:GNAT superfamily N-acetyltransferase
MRSIHGSASVRPAAAITLRRAEPSDVPAIEAMHFLSVQALAGADYSHAEIEAFLGHLGTYDPGLIDEGTYYVLENRGQVVASGGWSQHLPHAPEGAETLPQAFTLSSRSAKIRSIFVHPKYARLGLGSRLVRHAEAEAVAAGHRLFELWATLTGVPLYRMLGYAALGRMAIPGGNGATLAAEHMAKLVVRSSDDATAA